MKTLIDALVGAVAIVALAQAPAAAAEQVVCGRILGHNGATATAPGAFVIPQPGDVAPAGTYIVIPPGTQFTYAPTAWVCVRAIGSAPTQVFGGFVSTLTFVAFVAPGSPGYRAEPTPGPTASASLGRGGLPNTSTAPTGMPLALSVSALTIAGTSFLLRRRNAVS